MLSRPPGRIETYERISSTNLIVLNKRSTRCQWLLLDWRSGLSCSASLLAVAQWSARARELSVTQDDRKTQPDDDLQHKLSSPARHRSPFSKSDLKVGPVSPLPTLARNVS